MDIQPLNNVPTQVPVANATVEAPKPFAPYEEIQEKKTTKLGYVLLIIMVIVGLWQGQGFISSLAQNIPSPENISYCGQYLKGLVDARNTTNPTYAPYYAPYSDNSSSYYSNYRGYDSSDWISKCVYSKIEKKYSLENIINEILPLKTKAVSLQTNLQNIEQSSNQVQYNINTQKQNYNISLQEKMAGESGTVYDKSVVKSGLSEAESQYAELQNQKTQTQSELDGVNKSISDIAQKNVTAINNVFDEYTSAVKLVEFERALFLFLLISPILFLTVRKYFKHKRENSQYTIIWAAISTIFALLFTQVFIVFIYKILPKELIAKLIEFFAQFAFMVTILQYLLLFIVPAIFGGIVYWIQKKVYNKEAVMIRSLKNHKCPSCTMNLRESDRFCPICHYQIKDKCSGCGGDRVVGLAYCPSCGIKG